MPVNTNSIVAAGPTLIAKGTPSPSRVTSPPQIRSGNIPPQALAKDLDSLSSQINNLHGVLSSIGQTIEHLTLQDQQGNVVGIVGSEVYKGQYITNWFKSITIGGDPLHPDFVADDTGAVSLMNATITLTTSAGTILLDPTGPKITVTSPAGEIQIDASGPDILLTTTANSASLQLTSNPPQMLVRDHLGAVVVRIGVDMSGNGTIVLNGPTINNPNNVGTFTGTATVRNAAGTGTSTFTFVSGQCTAYAP